MITTDRHVTHVPQLCPATVRDILHMAETAETKPLLTKKEEKDDDDDDEEWRGCGPALLCDPRRGPHRFIVLIFTCMLNFGQNREIHVLAKETVPCYLRYRKLLLLRQSGCFAAANNNCLCLCSPRLANFSGYACDVGYGCDE